MSHFDYRHLERFFGLDDESSAAIDSAVYVLPVPLELTTSYIGGTKRGPAALIEASQQVELYDFDYDCEPAPTYGVHTLPALHPTLESPQAAVESITSAVGELLPALGDRLLVTLGGEHSLTPGVVAAIAPRYPDLIVVQIDAHSDLRDEYEGSHYSHACAARRILSYAPVIQFGIRSACAEEMQFARTSDRVQILRADAMRVDSAKTYLEKARAAVTGRPVYLTIDVDGLDPSVIRATGTPEPGGIGWYECLELIKTVAESGRIVALDCVELCPSPGEQASAFTAAKLIYKTINYIMRARGLI
ncbi:MAG: agmatinase [Aggregatilineales bacterium]